MKKRFISTSWIAEDTEAVLASLQGEIIAIQRPPGIGKSSTIGIAIANWVAFMSAYDPGVGSMETMLLHISKSWGEVKYRYVLEKKNKIPCTAQSNVAVNRVSVCIVKENHTR